MAYPTKASTINYHGNLFVVAILLKTVVTHLHSIFALLWYSEFLEHVNVMCNLDPLHSLLIYMLSK